MLPHVFPPGSPTSPPATPHKKETDKFSFSTQSSNAHIREHLSGFKGSNGAKGNPWREGDPYRFSPPKTRDPWGECMKLVHKQDDENCRGWKEHIDTLLVFAGLFSAAVTAFIIESYRQLQEDPTEASVRILAQISQQLSVMNNSTVVHQVIPPLDQASFTPSASALRINTCWFLSLTLSLSTALFGILCKQWLQEYQKDAPTASHKDSLGLRHMRFEGFHEWGVPIIVSILPILLQVSLVLFFAGLLDLLWSLHYLPALVTSFAIGLSVLILILTTILPAYYVLTWESRSTSDSVFLSPFKSPQSWWFYRFTRLFYGRDSDHSPWYLEASDWSSIDFKFFRSHFPTSYGAHSYSIRSLKWINDLFGDNISTAKNLFHCLQEVSSEEMAFVIGEDQVGSRDELNQKFLSVHSWEKDLQLFCGELALRQINTSPKSHDIGASLWYLTLPGVIDCKSSPPEYDVFLHQVVSALRAHLLLGNVNSQDVDPILSLSRSLWTHSVPSVRISSLALLEDLEHWLSRPIPGPSEGSAVLLHRIRKCSMAIVTVLNNNASMLSSSTRIQKFTDALDGHLVALDDTIRSSSKPWTRRRWIQTRKVVDYLQQLWSMDKSPRTPHRPMDRSFSLDSTGVWSSMDTLHEDCSEDENNCGDLGLTRMSSAMF